MANPIEPGPMAVTDVRVKLLSNPDDKLRGFCSITLNQGFVVRDVKIIEGAEGLFIAMPSRKLTERCPRCRGKNHLRARFCNECGGALEAPRADREARARLHADIAHPINHGARETLQSAVLQAYEAERARVAAGGAPNLAEDDFEDDGLSGLGPLRPIGSVGVTPAPASPPAAPPPRPPAEAGLPARPSAGAAPEGDSRPRSDWRVPVRRARRRPPGAEGPGTAASADPAPPVGPA